MSWLPRLECQEKDFWKSIPTFFRIQLKLKWRVNPYTTDFLQKPYPNLDQNGQSLHLFSDQNRAKTMYPYGLYKEEALPQGLQTLKRVLFIFAT